MPRQAGCCEACLQYCEELDPCHVKSKGAGGSDDDWNILSMCRGCHSFQHSSGWGALIFRRPLITNALEARGWDWEWVHGRLLFDNPKLHSDESSSSL